MATGLLDQLQTTQNEPKRVMFDEDEIMGDGEKSPRVVGKRVRHLAAQPSPNTLEVNISDIGDWEKMANRLVTVMRVLAI